MLTNIFQRGWNHQPEEVWKGILLDFVKAIQHLAVDLASIG